MGTRPRGWGGGRVGVRGGGFVALFWGSAVCAGEHPGVPPAVSPSTGALTLDLKVLPLTLQDVVYLALLNNRDVKIERLNPEVAATGVSQARAVFDPSLSM